MCILIYFPQASKTKIEKDLPNQLYVGELPLGADKTTVEAHFAKYGELSRFAMPVNNSTGGHKGYAFVAYKKASHMKSAMAGTNKVSI